MPSGAPLVISVYVEGDEKRTKQRVVVPNTWDDLIALLKDKLSLPEVGTVSDVSGSRIEFLEVIRDGDVLRVAPPEPATPLTLARRSSSHASSGRGISGAGDDDHHHHAGGSPGSSHGHAGSIGLSREDAVDMQIVSAANAANFDLEAPVGGGTSGHVFSAKCTRPGLSVPEREYALKVVYSFGVSTRVARNTYENECDVLSALPRHQNVTRFWGQFLDEIPDAVLAAMPDFQQRQASYVDHSGATRRRRAQFVVVDYFRTSLRAARSRMAVPLAGATLVRYLGDILRAVAHFDVHRIAHLDLKLENLLLAPPSETGSASIAFAPEDGKVVVADFGAAVRFPTASMELAFVSGLFVGGNHMHLAPEVLNAWDALRRAPAGTTGTISYLRQEVWAAGVLAYELATGVPPWPDYPHDCGGAGRVAYDTAALEPLSSSYPAELRRLILRMLSLDPVSRPTADKALRELVTIAASMGVEVAGPVVQRGTDGEGGGAGFGGGGGGGVGPGAGMERSGLAPGMHDSGRGSGGGGGATLAVRVQNVDGHEALLDMELDATVADLKAKAAAHLYPDRVLDEWVWEVVHAGRKLSDALMVAGLRLADDTVLHLLSLPPGGVASSNAVVSTLPDGPVSIVFDAAAKSPSISVTGDMHTAHSTAWGSIKLKYVGIPGGLRSGIHEWTFRVTNKAPTGGICLGVCTAEFNAATKNVGAAPGSWGYSSSGKKSAGSPSFTPYGPPFNTGDVIKMELNCNAGVLRYFRNGRDLGHAFVGLTGIELFPAVCMGGKRPGSADLDHTVTCVNPTDGGASGAAGDSESKASDAAARTAAALLPLSAEDYMFSMDKKNSNVAVLEGGVVARGSAWGSVLLRYPSLQPDTGLHIFKFLVRHKAVTGGVCVGVCDKMFDVKTKNVGASLLSWGYSSSGKKSDGNPDFMQYGDRFRDGDVIGMEVDTSEGTVRFTRNGADQGVAFSSGLRGHTLRPVACVGGAEEGDAHEIESLEVVRIFDPTQAAQAISVTNHGATVTSGSGWGSCFVRHSGIRRGKHTWSIRVDTLAPRGGVCVGLAEASFNIRAANIGASPASWAYSNNGKKGLGSASWQLYGKPFRSGDVIGVEVDLDEGTLRFAKNGEDQGIAFSGLRAGVSYVPAVCAGGAPEGHNHSLSVELSTIYLPADAARKAEVSAGDKRGGALRRSSARPGDDPGGAGGGGGDGSAAASGAGAGAAGGGADSKLRYSQSDRHRDVVSLSMNDSQAEATAWGSVVVDAPWADSGEVEWAFKIVRKAAAGGICIGLVDDTFEATRSNVGAAAGSFGYSSSGKKSAGTPTFTPYGAVFGTGDVVAVVANFDLGSVRFKVNGEDQGLAFEDHRLATKRFRPAVCLGGSRDDSHVVGIVSPEAGHACTLFFDATLRHSSSVLELDNQAVAFTNWGSALLHIKPLTSGRHRFHFQIAEKANSGGICVGVVDAVRFDAARKNVAASAHSWGYSSSGKKGGGNPRFVDYGIAFSTGDVIGMEVDVERGRMSFAVNGRAQGLAYDGVRAAAGLVPAVCGGGVPMGVNPHRVAVVQRPTAFDKGRSNRSFSFGEGGRTVETTEWGSVYLNSNPMVYGRYMWTIRVDHKASAGGICIGVADVNDFDVAENNVGADRGSWGYSSLGKKSGGNETFDDYGPGFGSGDEIGVELDCLAGTLAFYKNGESLGVAFSRGISGLQLVPAVCAGGSRSSPHKLTVLEPPL